MLTLTLTLRSANPKHPHVYVAGAQKHYSGGKLDRGFGVMSDFLQSSSNDNDVQGTQSLFTKLLQSYLFLISTFCVYTDLSSK